jgi:hypothetical protein
MSNNLFCQGTLVCRRLQPSRTCFASTRLGDRRTTASRDTSLVPRGTPGLLRGMLHPRVVAMGGLWEHSEKAGCNTEQSRIDFAPAGYPRGVPRGVAQGTPLLVIRNGSAAIPRGFPGVPPRYPIPRGYTAGNPRGVAAAVPRLHPRTIKSHVAPGVAASRVAIPPLIDTLGNPHPSCHHPREVPSGGGVPGPVSFPHSPARSCTRGVL